MAIVGEEQTASETARFCSECGALSEGRFCVQCGHNTVPAIPAIALPAPPGQATRSGSSSASPPGRSRRLPLAAAGALGVAAIAVAAVILLTGSSSSNSGSAYGHQLTGALAPMVSTETALASSLQNLSGSDATAAKNADSQAQTALESARGAVSVLSVPSGSSQQSQQVEQALTQLSAYLQALSAALDSPTAADVSQLQTSATSTQSSLIPVAAVTPGVGQAVSSGTQALSSWVSTRTAAAAAAAAHRRAARRHAQQEQQSATSTGTQTAPTTQAPPPLSGSTSCGGGLTAGPNTSCPFAENVEVAWDDAPGDVATVTAYSPVTNQTYTMSCAPAGDGITCSGADNASLSFPS
jgi:hypothetical protein